MQITKQADYAVRAVLELATNGSHDRLTAEQIAERRAIPLAFLSKTLGRLAEVGIVHTRRGVKGGVELNRTPANITLLEVVEAIDGPIALNQCVLDEESCRWSDSCPVHGVWCQLQSQLRAQLDSMSFSDMLNGKALELQPIAQ
jgi:Rrf2 family protein